MTDPTFDPFEPGFDAWPYDQYRRLREADPVHWSELLCGWVLTRYDDAVRIVRDQTVSSDLDRATPSPVVDMLRARSDRSERDGLTLVLQDGAAHTRLRKLIQAPFTARSIERLRDSVQRRVDAALDDLADRGSMELIADFAYPLPVGVFCEMLGIPDEAGPRFGQWTAAVARSLDLVISEDDYAACMVLLEEMQEYLSEQAERKRAEPGDVQRDELGDELALGEPLPVDLGVHERRQHVVARVGPLPLGLRPEVGLHLLQQHHAGGVVVLADDEVEAAGDRRGPLPEPGTGLVGDPEHLAEHADRQRVGEVGDQLHRSAVDEGVDGGVDPALHRRPQPLGAPGRERRLDQPAGPGVVGVVLEHEGRPVELAAVGPGPQHVDDRRRRGPVEVARHGLVAQDAVDVLVAGQHPPAEQLGAVDGLGLAQPAVLVVGPGVEAGFERVEGDDRVHTSTGTGTASTPVRHGRPAALTASHFARSSPVCPRSSGVGPNRSANGWRASTSNP